MDRTPPSAVLRALRKEVGFGCPVRGCREIFLTWHHFDPPWNVEKHHRPEGMIALCGPHHAAADRGIYSKQELRNLKQANIDKPAQGELPWAKKQFLVRLGGNYSGGDTVPVAVAGAPVISLHKSEDLSVLLSFTLRDADGAVVAEMEDNMFSIDPTRVTDVEAKASGTSLKFWLAPQSVGLDVSFGRLSLEQLSDVLAVDFSDAKARMRGVPDDLREDILNSPDLVGPAVQDWVASNCLDDEGKVPFLNFKKLTLYRGSRPVVVSHGIGTLQYCASFGGKVGFSL